MPKKRFLILIAAAALCVFAAGVFAVGVGFYLLHRPAAPGGGLRLYRIDQVPSSHPGYLRNTMTAGDDVYVNDYEEAALQLANPDPATVIAFKGNFGYSKVCAIPGQPTTAYVAGDDGSEMPAFAVYRHNGQPPFDWRTAKFRQMTLYAPKEANTGRETSDPALLEEVVALLRTGTPVSLPGFPMTEAASMPCLKMASDQLPGMLFCPVLRKGADGTTYIAESLMLDLTITPPQYHANWSPVSSKLAEWLRSR